MNVTSLELSKELYQVSGWDNTLAGARERWVKLPDGSWDSLRLSDVVANGLDKQLWFTGIPAYDLGYLLRKLPKTVSTEPFLPAWFSLEPISDDRWAASYRKGAAKADIDEWADTPEDAAAKLAIELFKQGILKK